MALVFVDDIDAVELLLCDPDLMLILVLLNSTEYLFFFGIGQDTGDVQVTAAEEQDC